LSGIGRKWQKEPMAKLLRNLALKCLLPALMLILPMRAFADPSAAANCRAGLNPEAQLIYDTVFPLITPNTVIRDVIKQQTRSLVLAGKVKRSSARDSAKAAGQCFRLLRQ
jgi:hypothetical protein